MKQASTHPAITSAGKFRTELHGLRAVSILMVVVYHVWIGRVSGGIDIFLLISSYLLMQTFLRRIDRGGPLNVVQYCLKAFRRLMPPAVITILATLALVFFFYPPERLRGALAEAFSSAAYYENWYLAFTSADYYANKDQVSPFQHFWSLSIQGQIFLAWPILILLTVWVARRIKVRERTALWVVYGTIFVCSLAWSVYLTNANQTYAYFSTFTRLWEFAMGALFALALPPFERRFNFGPNYEGDPSYINRLVRAVVAWVAFIAILLCGVIWDVQGGFPGFMALWPTTGALLVIAAGRTYLPWAADRLLSTRPLQYLGDISYSLYLVHWPLLITLTVTAKDGHPGWLRKIAVLVGAIAAAGLITKFVDAPIRYSKWLNQKRRRSVTVIAVAAVVGLLPISGASIYLDGKIKKAEARAHLNNPGAAILITGKNPPSKAQILPLKTELSGDWVGLSNEDCNAKWSPADKHLADVCQSEPVADPKKNVVLIGNSRLQQYSGMIAQAAPKLGWQLFGFYFGGCTFMGGDPSKASREDEKVCLENNAKLQKYVLEKKPDLVIFEDTYLPKDGKEQLPPNIAQAAQKFTSAGIDVLGIRDMPRLKEQPLTCLADKSVDQCSFAASKLFADPSPAAGLPQEVSGPGRYYQIDPIPWICPGGTCRPIVGNIYTMQDTNHISGTYSRSMGALFVREVQNLGLTN